MGSGGVIKVCYVWMVAVLQGPKLTGLWAREFLSSMCQEDNFLDLTPGFLNYS